MNKPGKLQREFAKWTLPKRLWAENINGGKLTADDKAVFYPVIEDIFRSMTRQEIQGILKLYWDCPDLPQRDRQKIIELMRL